MELTPKRPTLPPNLIAALAALEESELFRAEFGGTFIDYLLKVKGNEAGRFQTFLEDNGLDGLGEDITAWEQNEYFYFF